MAQRAVETLVVFSADGAAVIPSSQWGQQSALPTAHQTPSGWNKRGFWAERSVSMVETSSLGWAATETKRSPNSPSPVPLSASGSLLSSSLLFSSSSRYKTELCRTFAESGICKYGGKCQFAHGFEELRDLNRHPKYKTEPCRTFHTIGFCPYGARCHFIHNNEDDLPPPLLLFLIKDPQPQFLPSPDSGCSQCGCSPVPSPTLQQQSPASGSGCGGVQRSPSYTSLSDQDSSSSSSLSGGSDPGSGGEANGRRLPIFSQMSVPDDGLTS
ncbi:uncharacterized protein FYW47_010181 [Aplochiton taeniatus]